MKNLYYQIHINILIENFMNMIRKENPTFNDDFHKNTKNFFKIKIIEITTSHIRLKLKDKIIQLNSLI